VFNSFVIPKIQGKEQIPDCSSSTDVDVTVYDCQLQRTVYRPRQAKPVYLPRPPSGFWKKIEIKEKNISVTRSKDNCNDNTQKVFSVFTSRCSVAASTADVPPPLGPRTVPGLSYQILTSQSYNSQPTQQRTLLCLRAGGHLKPTSYSFNCRLKTLVTAAGPRCIATARTAHETHVSFIIACSHVSGERTCPHNCSLATALVLLPVYTAFTWQWVYMSQYKVVDHKSVDNCSVPLSTK
jgi:hypothetical protein